jgi:hypothetical protein
VEDSKQNHPGTEHDQQWCDGGPIGLPHGEADQYAARGDKDESRVAVEPSCRW